RQLLYDFLDILDLQNENKDGPVEIFVFQGKVCNLVGQFFFILALMLQINRLLSLLSAPDMMNRLSRRIGNDIRWILLGISQLERLRILPFCSVSSGCCR